MSIMQATLLMALAAVFSDSPIEGIGRGVGVVGGGAGNQNSEHNKEFGTILLVKLPIFLKVPTLINLHSMSLYMVVVLLNSLYRRFSCNN